MPPSPYSSIHLTPSPPYFPSHNRKLHLLLSYYPCLFLKASGNYQSWNVSTFQPQKCLNNGIGWIPFKPYREEGMIKEPIMWGKKDRMSVSVNKVVFIFLHLYCDPQGCSRYLARSHVAVSLWADSTLATSCPASHSITLTVRQLLWEISFTTADAQAYASNPCLKYICHFCLSKQRKCPQISVINELFSDFLVGKNKSHKFTFEGEPECQRRLHHSKPSRRP